MAKKKEKVITIKLDASDKIKINISKGMNALEAIGILRLAETMIIDNHKK